MKEDFQQKLAKAIDEEKRKALLAEQRRRIAALNKQRQQETQKTLAQVKQKIKTQQTVKKETVKSDNNNQKNKTITSANKQDKPVEQIKVQENKPQEIKPIVKEKKPEVKKPIIREGDIVPITELDKPLKILKNPSPRLTYAETKLGSVRLVMQVLVNTKGKAEKFKILRIIPQIAGLDARMRKVIKYWKFSIPRKKGVKVKSWRMVSLLIKK